MSIPGEALKWAPIVGPLVGVWIGSALTRRTTRQGVLRDRIFTEINRRREVGVKYKRAAWAFSAKVDRICKAAEEYSEARMAGRPPKKLTQDEAVRLFDEGRKQQAELRDAFAELESFSTADVQMPARDCMEALTAAFNLATDIQVAEARARYAFYQQRYEDLALALNYEADVYNRILYREFTPWWQAVVGRIRRHPLPYRANTPPLELHRPDRQLIDG